MTTITKERLTKILIETMALIKERSSRTGNSSGISTEVNAELFAEVTRIALALLEAEPVAWTDADELRDVKNGGSGYLFAIGGDANKFADPRRQITLYTAPPTPVSVPDVVNVLLNHLEDVLPDEAFNLIDVKTWNNVSMLSRPDVFRAAMLQGKSDSKPELTVWYGAMPETNGKTNWTAILHRKGECLSTGITIDRSEYPDRVRYEADRMSHLIGELADEPDILAYDADAHSGYVEPVSNRDELPLSYRQGHQDGLEWAAQLAEANHPQTGDWLYDDQAELAKAIRKGPDMPPVESGKSPVIPDCWCHTCRPVTMSDMRFVVCPECGNKRCPHASDHNNACTGSNEPGQAGSAYPAAPLSGPQPLPELDSVAKNTKSLTGYSPVIDRQSICDKVYGKCSRIPGATFYNAAEFALDEVDAAMTQGSQPVSDELPEIECDICGFKSTDPDGVHYCCEDNSND